MWARGVGTLGRDSLVGVLLRTQRYNVRAGPRGGLRAAKHTEMAVTIGSATETHALTVAMDGASMGVALTVRGDEDEAALRNLMNAFVREVLARVLPP